MASDNDSPAQLPVQMPTQASAQEPVQEPDAARRAWQGNAAKGSAKARGTRQRKKVLIFAAVLSALLTLVVVLIQYIDFPTVSPAFLTINVAEHNHKHFPLQAFARADSELLMQHFGDGKKKEAVTRSKELLLNELNGLKDRSTDPLVIHLSAIALVRDETVYLLPADAEPDSDATWLNVEQVLHAVEKCPAKHKLLILDLAHGLIDPRLGVHADRVAATLEAHLQKSEPSFLVLCPCSAGQSSLTSEVLRSSVFAYYLDQGLLGEADADKGGGISVRELVEFIQPRVDRWARNNRGVMQKPRLFGKGVNFIVAPLGRTASEKKAPAAPDAYPSAILDAWKKHDEAWNRDAFRQAPRRFLQLEANLLRDESRWRGGGAGKAVLDQETRNLLDEVGKLVAVPAPASRLLSVVGVKDNTAVTKSVVNAFLRAVDVKKALEEITSLLLKDKNVDYPQHVRIVVDAVSQLAELKQNDLMLAQAVLAGLTGKEQFVEVIYLERLVRFAKDEFPETFQKANVEVLWRTMREREAALAASAAEPELLPWVALSLETADKQRRVAEGKLLWERPPIWPEAIRELKASGEVYDKVRKTLEGMQSGSLALNRALADLPAYPRIVGDGPDADPYAEQLWFKAIDEAVYLQKYLAAAPDAQTLVEAKLDTHGRDLQQHLDELAKSIRVRIQSIEDFETPTAQRRIRGLLQSPRIKAVERADLTRKVRQAAAKLHDATETSDQLVAKTGEGNSCTVRAEMSIALLRLTGIEPDGPEFLLPTRKELPGRGLREKILHHLWGTEGLVKRLREATPDRRGHALSCFASPWDPGAKDDDPTRRWQATLVDEHLQWLRGQYELEGREAGPRNRKADDPRDQAIREFYRDAAQ